MILSNGTCTKSGLLLRWATILPFQGLVLNLQHAKGTILSYFHFADTRNERIWIDRSIDRDTASEHWTEGGVNVTLKVKHGGRFLICRKSSETLTCKRNPPHKNTGEATGCPKLQLTILPRAQQTTPTHQTARSSPMDTTHKANTRNGMYSIVEHNIPSTLQTAVPGRGPAEVTEILAQAVSCGNVCHANTTNSRQ